MRYVLLLFLAANTLCGAAGLEARFDEIVAARAADKKFMGAVLVAQGERVLFDKAYGSANLEWEIPNTTEAKFRLGSVTKQFTAASVLRLEEQGKLKTGDLVKKYVQDAPAAWDKITLYNLLTHTSGIPNFTNFPEYGELERRETTPENLVHVFRDKPLDFEPGTKWSYSNSGYILLGYVIEKVSGQTYQQYLDENIFKPLEMNGSGYDSASHIIPHRAYGYMPTPAGLVNASFVDMTVPFSAGALYSTTHDLLRWERALFGGKVLNSSSLTKMTTPFKNDYGCGLSINTINGRKRIEHGGGIQGFNTEMTYWPGENLTIIALANVNGSSPSDIAADLAATIHGEGVTLPSERKEITLTPERLKPFVGRYALAPELNADITLEENQLHVQLTGQPRFALFAQSPTSFFLKVVEAQIDFKQESNGSVTQFTLHQGGRDVIAKKTSETVPATTHKEISQSADQLKAYVGTYALAPNFDLAVTLEGDHLVAQATGQPKAPIFAEGLDKFFYKVVEAQLEFTRDSSGQVTGVALHQGGQNLQGKRK